MGAKNAQKISLKCRKNIDENREQMCKKMCGNSGGKMHEVEIEGQMCEKVNKN